jgi:putative ATP-binding cassette transporter
MFGSDGGASGQTESLGDKLLKLIPVPKNTEDKPRTSTKAYLGQILRKGVAGNSLGFLGLLLVLSAVCGTGVLFLLNSEAKGVERHSYSALNAVMFALLLVTYRLAQNRLIRSAAAAIEAALNDKRQRIVAEVLRLSLRDIELIEATRLRDGIAAHYGSLSQTLVPIIAGAEALVLLLFMFAYVLTLSVFAGALTVVVVGLTVIGFLSRSKAMEAELAAASAADARFRTLTDAIAQGTKELQLSLRRRLGLEQAMRDSSTALAKGRSASAAHLADLISTGTTISYLLAGAVVFAMPLLSSQADSNLSRVVIAVIFLLGPIGSVVQTAQQVATAQYALKAITGFEDDLAAHQSSGPNRSYAISQPTIEAADPEDFTTISLESVEYVHTGAQGFAINDVDLTLSKGEIVFLTGGNGSGKTTLLRVLTGLYPVGSGVLRLNGQDLPRLPPQSYRELFAAVFADFHLFDRPFGLDADELSVFAVWLDRLGIRDKLGDDLSVLDAKALSTGQRKRVALALALAEARPILVLDEWAADQDPETRQRFYEEILPTLRAEGRTIFAITHDEKYFHLCDRRLHMAEGRLVQEVQQ